MNLQSLQGGDSTVVPEQPISMHQKVLSSIPTTPTASEKIRALHGQDQLNKSYGHFINSIEDSLPEISSV